jgi:hypothetical protein
MAALRQNEPPSTSCAESHATCHHPSTGGTRSTLAPAIAAAMIDTLGRSPYQAPMRSRLRGLLLAVLVLVPLVVSGHHHATETASSGSCAICLVSHHAPAAVTPAPAAFALAAVEVAAPLPPATRPIERTHTPIAGRAPPSSFLLSVS